MLALLPLSGWAQQTEGETYPVNFDKGATLSRTDRYTNSIGFESPSGGQQTLAVGQQESKLVYNERLSHAFTAKAGESITPSVAYTPGTWMHTYVYLDRGCDGQFSFTLNDDYSIPEGSDVMSFSYYEACNSLGEKDLGNGSNNVTPPAFTLPADLPNGFYRLRYKVDWNSIDAGGNDKEGNLITANGGVIVDTRLNVHGDMATLRSVAATGGVLLNADGAELTAAEVPFGQPYTIKVQPAEGFALSHVVIRHGYNLEGDSLVHGTPQYLDVVVPAFLFREGVYTIPAECMDGDVRLTPVFRSHGGAAETGEDYALNFDKETLESANAESILRSIIMKATQGGSTTLNVPTSATTVYRNLTNKEVSVVPGDNVATTVRYTGGTMHFYFYVDYNQDGRFDTFLEADGRPSFSGELLSYSYYNGMNSLGETLATAEQAMTKIPDFVIPENLPTGVYRARFKVDYNNCDPGGQWAEGMTENRIDTNGGYVVDFLLNVHNPEHKLTILTTNGSIHASGNAGLPPTIAPFTARVICPKAAVEGYVADSITVKHGLNLDGPQYVRGNRQWSVFKRASAANISLPKDSLNGDVVIMADFKPTASAEYDLVWSEEFDAPDGTLPDAAKWERCDRQSPTWKRFLSINDEEHALTGYIEDGQFVARCIPNPFKDTDNVAMISGGIRTKGKYSFTYGKIEGRLKTEPHAGNFPAFWMMPQNTVEGWPYDGEIDIWEQIDGQDISHHTIHTKWANSTADGSECQGQANNPTKSGQYGSTTNGYYHTFGFEWTENMLTWYVNGKKVFSYAKSTNQDHLDRGQWPFDAPFYIILNQSVGNGSWAANVDTSHTYETLFDWVRVYQKKDPATSIDRVESSNDIDVYVSPGTIRIVAPETTKVLVADLEGRAVFSETVQGNHDVAVHKGIYIVNGKKVLVP